jgi:hypothetical protein
MLVLTDRTASELYVHPPDELAVRPGPGQGRDLGWEAEVAVYYQIFCSCRSSSSAVIVKS